MLAALALCLLAGNAVPAKESAVGARDLAASIRPVVVKASELPGLVGAPREKLALVFREGSGFFPAPFQVDPVDTSGEYVLGQADAPLTGATPKGPLSERDELVFMASDLGECGDPPKMSDNMVVEIAVKTQDGSIGCGYLAAWTEHEPLRSNADYVDYAAGGGRETISTPHYVQEFANSELFLDTLIILPEGGGSGRDLFDKLKMRSTVTAVGGITLSYDETDFESELTGVRDGPVRVIRRNETSLNLLLGFSTPSVRVNAFFYRDSYEVPSTLSFPFRADLILKNIDYYQGCDLSRASGPHVFYCDIMPEGARVDGVMSEKERELAANRSDHRWGMVTGPAGAWMYHGAWQDPGAPVELALFYEDDANKPRPPENEPGASMFGFRLMNALKMADRAYELSIVNYVIPEFNGDAEATARALTSPMEIKVKPVFTKSGG